MLTRAKATRSASAAVGPQRSARFSGFGRPDPRTATECEAGAAAVAGYRSGPPTVGSAGGPKHPRRPTVHPAGAARGNRGMSGTWWWAH